MKGFLMTSSATSTSTTTRERADFLESLARHRFFLRFTARDLTDEQARQCSTVSALSVGGLIKHVTGTEAGWAKFILEGPTALGSFDAGSWGEAEVAARAADFTMGADESLAGLLAAYDEVARITDQIVAELPDLDAAHPLPEAPWFESGAQWSARRVLLHIVAETAQHAGHADIIRESLDGAKTMG
jgi:uncharacterized damage-inducible protein DinB